MVQITEEEIKVSIFDPNESYEENEGEIPSEIKAFIKITKEGNIEVSNVDSDSGTVIINIKDEVKADIGGGVTIAVTGDASITSPNITVEGTSSIKVDSSDITVKGSSSITVESSDVTITGGMLTTRGSVAPQGTGPFCAIPICPLTGAPHVGPKVMGT